MRKHTKRETLTKRRRALAYARWCKAQNVYWKNFVPNLFRGTGKLIVTIIVVAYRIVAASVKMFFSGPLFGIPLIPSDIQKKMNRVSYINKHPNGDWRTKLSIISWWLQTRLAFTFLIAVAVIVMFGTSEPKELLSPVVQYDTANAETMPSNLITAPSATPSATPSETPKQSINVSEVDWGNFEEAYILTSRYSDIIYKQWTLESGRGKSGVAATCRNGKRLADGRIIKGFNDFGYNIKQDGDLFCFPTFEASVDAMVAWWDKNWIDQTLDLALCRYNKGGQSIWVTHPELCAGLKYVVDFHSLPEAPVVSAK